MTTFLSLTPRDPLVARDGRPFGAGGGNRMRSLDWFYPQLAAGSFRSLLGKLDGGQFADSTFRDNLKAVEVAGPFPEWNRELYFPCPRDLVVKEAGKISYAVRPIAFEPSEGGCDLPSSFCLPACLPGSATEDFKPVAAPAFWSQTRMVEWLVSPHGDDVPAPPALQFADWRNPELLKLSGFLPSFPRQERFHVTMDNNTFAAQDSLLFKTVALELPSDLRMTLRVDDRMDRYARFLRDLNELHPLGGERRLVRWSHDPSATWDCPPAVANCLKNAPRVRMVLATPAIFKNGWMPADPVSGEWTIAGVKLRLVSAVTDRWRPVSGWSLEPLAETGRPGPKAIRRAVPAGSVYFFDVIGGDAAALSSQWLQPVGETPDKHNGFGLPLFGIWNPHR